MISQLYKFLVTSQAEPCEMCAYVCFSLQHEILTICDTSVIRNSFISQRDFDVFINYVLETHSLYAIMVTVTRNTEGIALIGTQSSRHLKLHVRCKETKWFSTAHMGHTNKKGRGHKAPDFICAQNKQQHRPINVVS